ncbi:MAG: OmpH family outer membrane protein [Crocinitomicaceae bacterium]|jgi:outer membrane protein|nr:OmpH family outer membrane protein [Crocinitomicaceae bacterium]
MKRLFILFVLSVGLLNQVNAQSLAYIDSDFIMGKIPEYNEAKAKLDKLAETWTKDIEERYKVIKQQKENFNKEEILLPSEEKSKRKSEIDKLEKETLDLQSQRFGLNGDYFMKRQELIKPIQDRIYTAMKKVAKAEGYSFVFDKANQNNLIYADSEADISEYVLDEMGISNE